MSEDTTTSRYYESKLEQYEDQIKKIEQNNGKIATDLVVKVLNLINESSIRRPDLVVHLGRKLLFQGKPNLGDAVWDVYEQVLKAAINVNQTELASDCLEALQNKFGEGIRVRRLEAMLLESTGEYDHALDEYNSILGQDPTDQLCLKRKVAIAKARGETEDAVRYLNQYLAVYMADPEAYAELADLYLSIPDYKKAAFCVEELLLQNPHNYLYHLKYADIKYSMEDYATARSYYSQSLNIKKDNVRALYGLLMCTNALSSGSSKDKSNNTKLMEYAEKELMRKFISVSVIMWKLFDRTKSFFSKPIVHDMLISGSLYGVGDLICQTIQKKNQDEFDLVRTGRMVVYGTFVFGPVGHIWYKWLDSSVKASKPLTVVMKKLAWDELVFAPVCVFGFFVGISLLQGKTSRQSLEKAQSEFLPTYKLDLAVWPAVQFINFLLVPLKYRMALINFVNVFWNAYMSSVSTKDITDVENVKVEINQK
ncbi:ER membrane protein complex subunit 2 [Acrasis kona]|uniref:ER membrane protein complex subunit 2 n=1 Tax=Acrasis kona TaxID=1008807 RepID=A0AAW2YWQ1_9EUKA